MRQPTWVTTLAMNLGKKEAPFYTRDLRAALATADHPSTREPHSLAVVRELAFVSTTELVPAHIQHLPAWSEKELHELAAEIERWKATDHPNSENVALVHMMQHQARHQDQSEPTAQMLWPAARLLGNGFPYSPDNPHDPNAMPKPTTMPKAVADFLTVCHRASRSDRVIGERAVTAAIEAIDKIQA